MVDDRRSIPVAAGRAGRDARPEPAEADILFAVLGPLEVRRPTGECIRLDQRKKRTLLLTLLLHAGRWVSVDEIRLALWQDRPPRSATGNIKTYLSELRHTLPPAPPSAARAPGPSAPGPSAPGSAARVRRCRAWRFRAAAIRPGGR